MEKKGGRKGYGGGVPYKLKQFYFDTTSIGCSSINSSTMGYNLVDLGEWNITVG